MGMYWYSRRTKVAHAGAHNSRVYEHVKKEMGTSAEKLKEQARCMNTLSDEKLSTHLDNLLNIHVRKDDIIRKHLGIYEDRMRIIEKNIRAVKVRKTLHKKALKHFEQGNAHTIKLFNDLSVHPALKRGGLRQEIAKYEAEETKYA